MSFVTKSGSKQYIVEEGQQFVVDYLKDTKEGDIIELPVLMSIEGSKDQKTLKVKVIGHGKGPKIRVVKYKNKNNYHKQSGFRAHQTVLEVVKSTKSTAKKTEDKATKSEAPKKVAKTTTKAKKESAK